MQANGASQADLSKTVETSAAEIEKMAVKFGMSKEEAHKYAEQILTIPAARATQISADTSQASAAIQGLFSYWSSKTINSPRGRSAEPGRPRIRRRWTCRWSRIGHVRQHPGAAVQR